MVEHGLSERVVALARALRDAGGRVSQVEISDAILTLEHVPLERREAVRGALAASLCKEPTLREAFDRLFAIAFPLTNTLEAAGSRRSSEEPHAGGRSRGEEQDELGRALAADGDELLRQFARRRVEEQVDVEPDAEVSIDASVFRAMRGLNLDAVFDSAREQAVEGEGRHALDRKIVTEDLADRLEMFREMLRDEVYSQMQGEAGLDTLLARERRAPPEEVDFLWARESDLERVRSALAPLARALTAQLSHRRRLARRGRLDLRRTLRRSLSTGGLPVTPCFRRPVAGKPEIVIVCDISGSMRAFAKFALELTYALATQFSRVRSFVFVDALDEVTDAFDASGSLESALDRVDREAEVVEWDGQSWYGNSFAQLRQRVGGELAPNTTVVVIGDARGNFRSTGAEDLQRIRERVRHLWWLNPEPREHWDTGDSVMGEYTGVCDGAFEVRNLRQLQQFVATLA